MEQPPEGHENLIGSTVVALNGDTLGTIHTAQPHDVIVECHDTTPPSDYEVPVQAIAGIDDGKVMLLVNREALNPVSDEQQSAAYRLHEEA